MRLLLDEMYPRVVADRLRERGHEVGCVHDGPGSGTPDEDVFEYAREHGLALVTENVRDDRPLAESPLLGGRSHAGLVFTTAKRWPRDNPGALISALDRLLQTTSVQPIDREIWL